MNLKELMEHLLNGGKISYGKGFRYEQLNSEGDLVYSDGTKATLGTLELYFIYEEPKYQALYLIYGKTYETTCNVFSTEESAKACLSNRNENCVFVKLLKPEEM